MIPVILSGGNGTRLWPLSRKGYPKQFLPLIGESTMLQATLQRLPAELAPPLVVCNQEHRFIVSEQLQKINLRPEAVLLEPFGRNTAPAVAIAALFVVGRDPDATLLVLPADHYLEDFKTYHAALDTAKALAAQQNLVLFGIRPTAPECGYGYIRTGDAVDGCGYKVSAFVEKPDKETAQSYLEAGDYLWNSGMFALHAQTYLDELQHYRPDMFNACCEAALNLTAVGDAWRIPAAEFRNCHSESIDYAVMENTDRALAVPLDCGWSDVGSWSSLWDAHEQDADGNVLLGDTLAHDSRTCFVRGRRKLISLVGVENLVVADTEDALLIAHRDKVQDVKLVVDRLNQDHRPETLLHREVARPWGTYDSIDQGERFQVKRIKVKPGGRLSLQKHHHRAEHWVVVQGTALVTCDDKQFLLTENQSTYIPVGSVHRLENPGKVMLEIIEVQSGCYLGEDDIVRLEDTYGRAESPAPAKKHGKPEVVK